MPNDDEDTKTPEPDTLKIANEALKHGFTIIPNYVLRAPDLSRDAKLLYGILLSYAWQKGRCFPGYGTLQRDMGSGSAQVSKYLRELREAGWLKITRRGQGRTNIYELTDPTRSALFFQNERTRTSELKEPDTTKTKEKEDSVEENSDEKDLDLSNLRMASPERKSGDLESQNGISGEKKRGAGGWRGRKSTAVYDENREVILDYIKDFAPELGDEAKLASSVTRAQNIFRRSGISMEAFIGKMYEARSIVKENSGKIRKETKPDGKAFSVKSRMAYWFATLENLLDGSTIASPAQEIETAETAGTVSQRLL
jgi:DNA-binding transcriptional ArsR family regulator